jgi:hypothetical protein
MTGRFRSTSMQKKKVDIPRTEWEKQSNRAAIIVRWKRIVSTAGL